jgi:hypothetical protein
MIDFWKIAVNSDCLFFTIQAPKEKEFSKGYRTDIWSNYFGVIQDAIRQKKFDGKVFGRLSIDMSSCTWIDPIPLLSLLISLLEFCTEGGFCHLKFSDDVIEQKSLLPFLEQEGFFNILERYHISFSFGDIGPENNGQIFETIRKARYRLSYINSSVLSADIIDLKDKNIDSLIIDLIDKKSRMRNVVSSESYDTVYMKLYHILYELVDNVKRHAYRYDAKHIFAGVYIRYRFGMQNASITEMQKTEIEKLGKSEYSAHLEKLSDDLLRNTDGFLEVFVVDSGVGIEETLRGSIKKPGYKPYSFPLFGLFQRVYFHGLRNENSEKEAITPVSGINLIHNILQADSDYILVHEGRLWIGFNSVEEEQNMNNRMTIDQDAKLAGKKINVKGLSWIFRLSWEKKNVRENEYVNYFFKKGNKNDVTSHPVYEALDELNTTEIEEYRNKIVYIVDQRKCIEILQTEKIIGDATQALYFLWLPRKSHTKNGIIEHLESYAKKYSEKTNNEMQYKFAQKRTLVVLDVASHEIVVYRNALNGTKDDNYRMKHFFTLFDQIIICSKLYEVMAFTLKNGEQRKNKELRQDKKIENAFLNCKDPRLNIKKIALYLKSHDSYLFWNTIEGNPEKDDYFLNANIEWVEGLSINGFFYFENIINNSDLYWLLYNSLERIIGLFPKKNAHFTGSDSMVQQIVDALNDNYFDSSTINTININSVFVTGKTASSAMNETQDNNSITINYFHNKNIIDVSGTIKNEGLKTLLIWPKDERIENFSKENVKYKRIANTHMIARSVDDQLIIKRKNYDKREIYNQSIADTYRDLQSEGIGIIRLGHYFYDTNHILFNVKYKNIFEDSRRSGNGMFPYLFITIFFSLLAARTQNSGEVDEIIEKVQDKTLRDEIKKLRASPVKRSKYCYDEKGVSLVVYPTHYYSSLIMRDIVSLLPPDFRSYIVPLNRAPSKNGNVFGVSPKSMAILEKKINNLERKRHDILFFDTIIESGRTRKSIKHILSAYDEKIKTIKTLSVVDSQKLSFKNPDVTRHKAYWRLDLPRLGGKNTCKLCQALSLLKDIIMTVRVVERKSAPTFMSPDEIIKTVKRWENAWQVISALEHRLSHGISVNALSETVNISSIDKDFSPGIMTNIGLAVYASELEFLSLRDDIFERILNEKGILGENELIVLLISCRLLLYGDFSLKAFHIKMLQNLIIALANMTVEDKKTDNYSILGCLVLLTQDTKLLTSAILSLSDERKEGIVCKRGGNDLKIVLGYLSQKKEEIGYRLYDFLPYEITTAFHVMKKRDAYIYFHYELISEKAGDYHTRPLADLVCYAYIQKEEYLRRAKTSLNTIGEKLSYILPPSSNTFKSINGQIIDLSAKMWSFLGSSDKNTVKWQEIKQNTENILGQLKSEHMRHFLPLSKYGELKTLDQKILELVEKHSCRYEIKEKAKEDEKEKAVIVPYNVFSLSENNDRTRWCFWDNLIESEFVSLLSNVRHCCGKVIINSEKSGNMAVTTKYENNYCKIKLRNLSRYSGDHCNDERGKKSRNELVHLEDLGIKYSAKSTLCSGIKKYHHLINSSNNNYYILSVNFEIPILSKEILSEKR